MSQSLTPARKIGDLQFYKFPYLDVLIALTPQDAISDLGNILSQLVSNEQSAAVTLQRLIDTGRKAGLQIFISVEYPDSALPEVHRLTVAMMALDKWNDLYITPAGGAAYQKSKLVQLFA